MNQILITKKLYVTPELKRKKKIYKFDFFISVFLVCILLSICIYAEYDRNKSEEVSQSILENIVMPETAKEDTTVVKNNILMVVLDEDEQEEISDAEARALAQAAQTVMTTAKGFQYQSIATIRIPKIGIEYAIIDGPTDSVEETEDLLKISPTKFWGPGPNEIGNFCIVGHNYRNTRFFSKVPTLESGDIIEITDLLNKTVKYQVYNKYEVDPRDKSCTSQYTNGKKEVTLITCTNDSARRVIVKARAIKN